MTVDMVARRTEVDNLRAQCSPTSRRLTRTYSAICNWWRLRMVTLRDACGFGWMAMACPPGRSSGQVTRDGRLARASLQLSGWRGGLAFFEEFVHDLGAGGDDGA